MTSFREPYGGFFGSDPFENSGFTPNKSIDGADFEFFDQEDPRSIVSGLANRRGLRGGRRKAFEGLFGDVLARYKGFLAQQALAGNQPQGNFTDFALGQFGNRSIDDLFNNLGPAELGLGTANLNPRTTFY